MRKGRLWVLIAVIVLVVVSLACGDSTPTAEAPDEPAAEEATEAPPAEEPPAEEEEMETITTVRGEMTVPGIGYLDGRDAEADPPLTVMDINIWDAAQRSKAVCELKHGTKVDVLDAEFVEDEDRYYFQISGGGCEGWIQAPFISPEYHESIGDEM